MSENQGRLLTPMDLKEDIKRLIAFNNKWVKVDEYHLKNGKYIITKSKIGTNYKYSIYVNDVRQWGVYDYADEAKEKCYEIEIEFEPQGSKI